MGGIQINFVQATGNPEGERSIGLEGGVCGASVESKEEEEQTKGMRMECGSRGIEGFLPGGYADPLGRYGSSSISASAILCCFNLHLHRLNLHHLPFSLASLPPTFDPLFPPSLPRPQTKANLTESAPSTQLPPPLETCVSRCQFQKLHCS